MVILAEQGKQHEILLNQREKRVCLLAYQVLKSYRIAYHF